MEIQTVKYNLKDKPEFFKELRKRVNAHFKENNISKFADLNMKIKTVFMILLYFVPFITILSGVISGSLAVLGMWVLMGVGMAGIGLSIMHDANHAAYSKKQSVNNALGYIINFLGSYHVTWKIQHNVLHHSYTNVHGLDEDIENEILRFSPNVEPKKGYRFQVFYAILLYGLLSLHRLISKDFEQLLRYHKMNLLPGQGITLKKALREIIFNKIAYAGIFIVLPLLIIDLPWWEIILGFVLMQYVSGLILALIFQAAHVVEETDFIKLDSEGSLENSWAIHQMRTTANFANKSKWFTWFVGGLNHQVEHHLFPSICHVHYSEIASIVEETAKEFDVPYHKKKTFFGALKSHFKMINDLGTGKYDRRFAEI